MLNQYGYAGYGILVGKNSVGLSGLVANLETCCYSPFFLSMRLVKNRRILIVDDRYDIHEDYRKILGRNENVEAELEATEAALFGGVDGKKTRTFYELGFTFSGEEALKVVAEEKAKKKEFALAFVDMRMGNGMDGLETIRRLSSWMILFRWLCQPLILTILGMIFRLLLVLMIGF